MTSKLTIAGILAVHLITPEVAAADLVVSVTGVRNNDGVIRIALYDNEHDFPHNNEVGRVVPAVEGETRIDFSGVADGTYAIAAYHDENDNNRFDKLLFGLPAEGFGFSNDARPFLSAPPFASAAFTVAETGVTNISFQMVYP